jgi:DNA-binding NtrC family response regulator
MPKTVLIVDDNRELCQAIRSILEFEGYRCLDRQSAPEALEILKNESVNAVLLDLNLGEGQMNGLEVLEKIHKEDPLLPVIMLTADSAVKTAVGAMKLGAYHYLTKPFDNDEVAVLVKKALEDRDKSRQIELLKARALPVKAPHVVGKSAVLKSALTLAEKIAPTDLTVILHGESGAGKELFAQLIHAKSARKDGPFVSLDCGTFQETLVESELFGYEKGAFTGADRRKLGQFELASGGTIFLDEIGNLPLPVQAKLLRVLQERKVQHLGGHREIEVDLRIVVASNRDLAQLVKAGHFREDLYHRLNQFTIEVPPLRKRSEDVEELAQYFLKAANREMNKKVPGFTSEALRTMRSYSWPGNVREFRNAVYRAVLLSDGEIEAEHLQISLNRNLFLQKTLDDSGSGAKVSLKKASKHATHILEKQIIEQTLKKCGNNKSLAAKRLKIDRKALYNKLKKYRIKL